MLSQRTAMPTVVRVVIRGRDRQSDLVELVTYACSGPALSTDVEAMRWCVEGRRAEMVVTMMRYVQAISRNSVEVTVPLALTRMAACCCCRIMHDQSTDFSHSGTAELFSIVNLRDSRFTIADCIHES